MYAVKRFVAWMSEGSYRLIPLLIGIFLLFNAVVRIGLAAFNGDASIFLNGQLLAAMLIGAVFDLGVAVYFVVPLAVGLVLLRRRERAVGMSFGRVLIALGLLLFAGTLVFVAASEFVFWNEFASRFNFIAVDYLVYTNEVIGNIRESYPMPLLLGTVALLSLGLWGLIWWRVGRAVQRNVPTFGGRLARSGVWLLLPLLSAFGLNARYAEFSGNAQANELASNGSFAFFHAFWANEIDYERFYSTLSDAKALSLVRRSLHIKGPAHAEFDISRPVAPTGSAQPWNVVLVSIESFSASFMAHFGNQQGLTPNMDRLADEGLLFTQLYATGTRTVRGLEALTLSIPPTPGNSIVKRPNNGNLYTLGSVFADNGYSRTYVYGGYSYFDNMQAFFSGNGYRVVDRTQLEPSDIHFQNVWGVCDEDLFSMALREIDVEAAKGPFFTHVMTVSNHRPYTYPEGRIDIPSKTGRDGGVKYTDWAIGDFVRRAREKSWFGNTLFVFVADHTHKGRGKTDLPPENYLIPMIIWAPGKIAPSTVDHVASQIDVAPTLLGLLNMGYQSRFFGSDALKPQAPQRALLANYQTVGWYQDDRVVELRPGNRSRVVNALTGVESPADAENTALTNMAIGYYQVASEAFGSGALRLDLPDLPATGVPVIAASGLSH